MDEHTRMNVNNDSTNPAELEEDILIGRLIDGEAKSSDERRFEQLAEVQPSLWRSLARRQREMLALATQVEQETCCADEVDLPRMSILPRRLTWPLAMSGWAAMLIVALTWATLVIYGDGQDRGVDRIGNGGGPGLPAPHQTQEPSLSELLEMYRSNASWAVLNLNTTLLGADSLEDGSLLIRTMRRFDEEFHVPQPYADRLREMMDNGEFEPIDPIELKRLLERMGWIEEPKTSGES